MPGHRWTPHKGPSGLLHQAPGSFSTRVPQRPQRPRHHPLPSWSLQVTLGSHMTQRQAQTSIQTRMRAPSVSSEKPLPSLSPLTFLILPRRSTMHPKRGGGGLWSALKDIFFS